MGREIKFRGKRIDTDKWVYGNYFTTPLTEDNSGLDSKHGWFFLSDGKRRHCIEDDGVAFVIDEKTLGQYTGLLDKKGAEIFQGDILQYSVDEEICVVKYWEEQSCFTSFKKDGEHKWANLDWYSEVIGNIYENPALLEKS